MVRQAVRAIAIEGCLSSCFTFGILDGETDSQLAKLRIPHCTVGVRKVEPLCPCASYPTCPCASSDRIRRNSNISVTNPTNVQPTSFPSAHCSS
jgi:hypothetical protein